jgi:hypothetical protein
MPAATGDAVTDVHASAKFGEDFVKVAAWPSDAVSGLAGALAGTAPFGKVLSSSEADLFEKFGREPSHDGDTTGRG